MPIHYNERNAAGPSANEIEPLYLPASISEAENQQLPAWLQRSVFDQSRHYEQALNETRYEIPREEVEYDEDGPDSDQEYAVFEADELVSNAVQAS